MNIIKITIIGLLSVFLFSCSATKKSTSSITVTSKITNNENIATSKFSKNEINFIYKREIALSHGVIAMRAAIKSCNKFSVDDIRLSKEIQKKKEQKLHNYLDSYGDESKNIESTNYLKNAEKYYIKMMSDEVCEGMKDDLGRLRKSKIS
jgi:hypothetical protein